MELRPCNYWSLQYNNVLLGTEKYTNQGFVYVPGTWIGGGVVLRRVAERYVDRGTGGEVLQAKSRRRGAQPAVMPVPDPGSRG